MIALAVGDTVAGGAASATTVTYTFNGDEITGTTDGFKTLVQGQLAAAAATIYTPAVPALIKVIHLQNTGGTGQAVALYINGTTASHRLWSATIPGNGSASYDGSGWRVYDANGVVQSVGSTGPSSTVAIGTTTTLAPGVSATVTDTGSPTAATFNFGIPRGANWQTSSGVPGGGLGSDGDYDLNLLTGDVYGPKTAGAWGSIIGNIKGPTGSTGPSGVVQSVTAGSANITVGGTTAFPTVDIASAYDSNVMHLAGTQTAGGQKTFSLPPVLTNGEVFTALTPPTYQAGQLFFDNVNDSLTFYNSDSNVSLQLGQEDWVRVKNSTGSTIANGQAVYVTGTDGANNMPTIALAKADAAATAKVVGITTESIANGAVGIITAFGGIHNLNTSGFTAGVPLYLSAATAGALTATAPSVPNLPVLVGYCLTSNASTGAIYTTPVGQVSAGGVSTVSGTAPIVSSGGTTPAISINAATAAAAGSLAAADFGHIPSGWIDVTRQGANSVLVGNTGSANNTAFAALLTAAPAGGVIYFPPGWYPFASNIALPAKPMVYQGSGSGLNGNLSAFTWTTALGGDKITCGAATSYVQFRDLGFIQQTTPETAGAVVNVNGQANVDFYQCEFTGINATNTLKDCITFGGASGGEESIVNGCDFTNFSGTAINANCNLSTLVFDSNTINGGLSGTTGAACGINITLGGAVQIVNSDIIGCTNNLLINPSVGTVVASVWATNTYFDNAFGSCIKITGAGATVRTKFEECSFTTAATASPANAVEVSSTFAYGVAGMGLDFVNCNVLNTFGTLGTGTGFNVTGAGDFRIAECEIAAWATGIAVTSANAAGMTRPTIQNNTIGNAGNYGINTTGISLAVGGGFAFGSVQINSNNLAGNTTPVVDGSGAPSIIGGKSISGNIGIANAPMVGAAPTARSAITVGGTGTLVPGTSLQLPTNAFRIGSVVMFDVSIDKTSVGTAAWVLGVKFGTANTVADTAIATFTTGVNSAAVDMATIKVFLTITAVGSGTSATCTASAIYTKSTGPAALGLGVLPVAGTPVAFNSTLASPFVHIDIIAGTSEVMTANGFATVLV